MQPLIDEHFAANWRRASGVSDSDVRLALAVVFELSCDPRTRREPIRVSAQNGVVILAGSVGSWQTRRAAAHAARAAVGVCDFCNVIQVATDARVVRPRDDFDQLAAGMDLAPRDGRAARFVVAAVVMVSWLLQPWLVVVGVPLIPALLTVLAITAAAVMTQLFRSPPAGMPPIR
ncbi:BON domain-containing protein [Actinoplanes sp. NPDC026619]|uniref:BON domain-containing protein n=1 Tax=Actinoplanes sp. NPDC026619 TaxID=3155798 RepID=UPI00340E5227